MLMLHSMKRSDVNRWKHGYITPLSHALFCETQWRHSVKARLYNIPSPMLHSVKRSDVTRWKHGYITPPLSCFILWNAVTSLGESTVIYHPLSHASFCETQWRHSVKARLYNTPSPMLHYVKRSDVTRWKHGYITPPLPCFTLWNAVTSLGESTVI